MSVIYGIRSFKIVGASLKYDCVDHISIYFGLAPLKYEFLALPLSIDPFSWERLCEVPLPLQGWANPTGCPLLGWLPRYRVRVEGCLFVFSPPDFWHFYIYIYFKKLLFFQHRQRGENADNGF